MREDLFNIKKNQINQKLTDLRLDESIMHPSGKDDFVHIEALVTRLGKEFAAEEYINDRTAKKVLKNMREL